MNWDHTINLLVTEALITNEMSISLKKKKKENISFFVLIGETCTSQHKWASRDLKEALWMK